VACPVQASHPLNGPTCARLTCTVLETWRERPALRPGTSSSSSLWLCVVCAQTASLARPRRQQLWLTDQTTLTFTSSLFVPLLPSLHLRLLDSGSCVREDRSVVFLPGRRPLLRIDSYPPSSTSTFRTNRDIDVDTQPNKHVHISKYLSQPSLNIARRAFEH
jgi:hypothetical protein